jgi:hypothetical protein
MRILEVIHLRMMEDDPEDLAEWVRVAAEDAHDTVEARVYRHSRLEGDLLIHFHRNEAGEDPRASALGMRLASLLRSHGLVEHSVWVQRGESREST